MIASLHRTLSVPYWRRRPGRLLLVTLSVALGVATWVATTGLDGALDRATRRAAAPPAGAADLHVGNGDAGLVRDLAATAAAVPGVRSVRPLVVCQAVLPDLGHRPATLLGVDLDAHSGDDPEWDVRLSDRLGRAYLRGLMVRRRVVLVGSDLDRELPDEGEPLSVLVAGQVHRLIRGGTVEPHGPAAALGGAVLVMALDDAAALTGRPDRVSRLDVTLDEGADREEVRGALTAALGSRAEVTDADGHDGRVQEMLAGLKAAYALCGAGALVVGAFLVYNALAVSAAERRHDVGVLRSLGATRFQIVSLFVGEAALLGLLGSCAGVPLGLGFARLALGPMRQAVSDLFVPLPWQELEVSAAALAGSAAAGVAAAVLAGLAPALKASAEPAVDVLRRVPPAGKAFRFGWQITASLLLAVGGLACVAVKGHLPARAGSCGGLGLVLAAVLVATPALTALMAGLLRRLPAGLLGVAGRLAVDNVLRAPGRTGLVVAALAAGVALLVQTGGLVRSNEAGVRSWVDRSIAGDLFVTSGGPLSASGRTLPMGWGVAARLGEEFPGLHVVPMRFRHLDWRQGGRSARVLLVALDAAGYVAANEHRPSPPADLELFRGLSEPGTVLVSENFAALHHVGPGDTLTLPGTDGPVSLRVLGAVADYSCHQGTVLADRQQIRRHFDADLVDVLDVYLPAGADAEAVRGRLRQSPWAAEQALCVLTRGEVRGHILGMVERLYGLAYAQEVVVALVAVLGVVTALLISVLQRRRELGLLRAVGATRGQVMTSVLAEAALLGGLGVGLGLLVGLPLEWYTVRVLLFEETGFLCPLLMPWAVTAACVGLTLACTLLAGVGPALHAARTPITEAVAPE